MRKFLLIAAVCLSLVSSAFAKRAAPRPVIPVFTTALRIEAPVDDGRVARIQAYDRSSGRLAWTVKVFETRIERNLEEDVQWRFIREMKLVGDVLEIAAEGGGQFRVSLATKAVEVVSPIKPFKGGASPGTGRSAS